MGLKKEEKFILWFKEITKEDTPFVGGKNASLGEMYQNLTKKGVRIPNGFAVTATAYRYFIKEAGLENFIEETLKGLDVKKVKDLKRRGAKIREAILKKLLPDDLKKEIIEAYHELSKGAADGRDVAVRSSATAEDLPSISENEHVLVKINGKPIYKRMGEIYDLVGDAGVFNVEIPSLKGKEIKWNEVKEIYRHRVNKEKLYKITTVTGREITISPNHTLIVLDEDTLKPREINSINDLKGCEKVPVIKKLPAIKSKSNFIDILDYIKGDDVVADKGLIKIKNRSTNWKIQNGLIRKIPVTKDFAYFLGLYLAEGSTYKTNEVMLTNSNKEVIGRIINLLKLIKLYRSRGRKINKHTLRISCKSLVRFLHETCGKPISGYKGKGKLCSVKEVPSFVFGWDMELIGEFLRGCFDGDSYVSKESIIYSSTSEMLIGGIVKLLEIIGIDFYLKRKRSSNSFDVIIPIYEVEKFKNIIGFEVEEKKNRLDKLIQRYKITKHIQFKNRIKITNFLSKKIRREFENNLPERIIQIDLCPDCGSKIEKSGYYKGKARFYCRTCYKTFYKTKKQKIKAYIYFDKRGRFKKGIVPWNKAVFSGSFSNKRFKELVKSYKINSLKDFFSNSVIWDQIKDIKPVDYNGMVYDFVVPGVQNFAAGIGGIITHNSASFAGQQETYLNIRGDFQVLEAVKKCIASLFTDRAISYREDRGFKHTDIALSVGIQEMVRSDKATAGVMFTLDTESGFKDVILINASYGLGENVVKGKVNPDEYYVFKTTLKQGFKPIIGKSLGSKETKLIYAEGGTQTVQNVPVSKEDQKRYALTDEEILELAKWGLLIEEHYQCFQDIEWAKDGITGELYIVQSRPETVHALKKQNVLEEYVLKKKGRVLIEGLAVGDKIGVGKANIILDVKDMDRFKEGEVLVTEITDPDWEPIMRKAAAIVTESGGKTSHAAIVSRELGIPCIVGTGRATKAIKDGEKITVSCSEGEVGRVYKGALPFEIKKTDLKEFKKPKTQIMMNVGVPREAFSLSFVPNDGVGLAREEFIIANFIKIHPLALAHFDEIKDKKLKAQIEKITGDYKNKKQFFIDKLAQGMGRIAAAFYPKEVIVRMSDFKTSEYANLIGGKGFEPEEGNPMLGWRGASRYYDKKFEEAFLMECQAFKKLRNEMGFKNVKIMIPFCRTPEEGKKTLEIMKETGLERGKDGLEVYVMVEIPSNVILADEFAKLFDGFSIGTNDLTQLTLGVDRDSELVAPIYDERSAAVKELVRVAIRVAHENGIKIGICGDAPSSYPEFAEFLVQEGIDSISLSPDAVIKTTLAILEEEKKLKES